MCISSIRSVTLPFKKRQHSFMHRDRLDFVVQLQEDPQKERFQKMKLVKSEQPGQNEREEI